MPRSIAWVVVAALALAADAAAQTVTGVVVDSLSKAPMPAVTVLLVEVADSLNRKAAVTDSAGRFSIVASKPGVYALYVRRLGFMPLGAPARQLDSGAVRTIRFEMNRLPVMLDTVRARSSVMTGFLFRLTRGQEFFTRHYREGKGFFTSGNEILLSRLNACDYFGQIPGLMISYIEPMLGESGLRCEDGRYIVTRQRPACFRTILDKKWTISQLDSTMVIVRTLEQEQLAATLRTGASPEFGGDTLGRAFPVAQLAGIEVFRNRSELPNDFSIPMNMGPPPTTRRVSSGQSINSRGPPVAMTHEASMQCAYVLVWSRSYW
jgi:hypothetical protein